MPFRAPWRRRDAAGRLTRALLRHRHRLLPAISFVAGWASYVLVERSAATVSYTHLTLPTICSV